jgi:hypothetical protein
MAYENTLPGPGFAEVHITASTPDAARLVAQVLRTWFASTEQRGRPAADAGRGTSLDLFVDTTRRSRPGTLQDRRPVSGGNVVTGARQIWP